MRLNRHKIYRYLVGIIFPPRCPVCDEILDEPGELVHDKCHAMLFSIDGNCCMHCGRALTIKNIELCPECQKKKKRNVITFSQGKSLWQYRGIIKQTMYRIKYSNKREYADYFAAIAAGKYQEWFAKKNIGAIVPVPMYRRKQKLRGYNQAEVFAKALSRETGIPMLGNMAVRTRDTAPMKNLNDKERKKNLQNAFQIDKGIVKYSYILLVDDIYTTGSTADALTEAMLLAGVKGVFFLSICTGREI